MAEYEVRKSVIPNVSDTEVPTTTTSEEYKNLVQNKVGEILNLNPDLKKQYKQETTLVPEPKKDPSQNLMLGPIVFPKYTQEELNFARGGRVKFASGSEDPESDLYIPPLDKSEETSKEGIYNTKRLGPEDKLSKYKSYSELELLGNIEAKKPNFEILEDYIYRNMPTYEPKDVVPKGSRPVMPNEYDRGPSDGILNLAVGGRVGFKDGPEDPNKLIPIDPLLQDQSPTDPGRRDVLKLGIAGAGLLGLGKLGLLKLGSVAKPSIIAEVTKGTTAPSWMEGLMTKILKEGTEIKMPKESSIIKKEVQFKNPETGDVQTATLTIDPRSDRMSIEYNSSTNVADQPVVLELYRERKAVQNPDGKSFHLAPDKTKGYRFTTTESGPRVVDWDGNIEFDAEDTYYKIIDLKSDISGLKSYATEGKGINKKVAQEKRAATADIEKNPEEYVPDNYPDNKYYPND
jgi:bifunctional DNA-binding transcriptional regulator/antitoxin component of YhaV-PrlF toxin-antitoxin module